MAKRKAEAEKVVTIQAAVPVVIWRANRPLTEAQHEELSRKLRFEQQHTGVEIVLVPNSVDVEVSIKFDQANGPEPGQADSGSAESNKEVKVDDGNGAAAKVDQTNGSKAGQPDDGAAANKGEGNE